MVFKAFVIRKKSEYLYEIQNKRTKSSNQFKALAFNLMLLYAFLKQLKKAVNSKFYTEIVKK